MLDHAELRHLIGVPDIDPDLLQAKYDAERDRRLRRDGRAQYVGVTDAFSKYGADPWADPHFVREPYEDHTEVIVVGGGFGGLVAGARLREAGITDTRIIEAASDFGGTWYWNRYPGAMCDIEAHIYMPLLEEMGYSPKHRYAHADELFEFSQEIGRRYGLYEKACFQTRVTSVTWQPEDACWLVTTDRGDRMTSSYLILAGGRQSLPKLPRIEGIGDFEGHVFHSSRWDYEYTDGDVDGRLSGLADKRVGVVGTGATALQIVPALAREAGKLQVFQRTPSAVGPRDNCETSADWIDTSTPGWQKRRRENFQNIILGRNLDDDEVQDGWTAYTKIKVPPAPEVLEAELGRKPTTEELDTAARLADFKLMNTVRDRIASIVDDPATAASLQPWYRWLCKRPGWHDEYLQSFNRPNVELVDTHGHGIERFTPSGVVVEGQEHEVDCVIFATGFEGGVSYTDLLGFDPVGRTGKTLSEHWTAGTRTWLGIMTDEFPNLFFLGGNQQTAAAFNAVHLIDEHAIQLAHILREVKVRDAGVVEPTSDAVDEYVEYVRTEGTSPQLLEFYAECTPGYFNAEGAAKKSEDLFAGGRCDDPIAYYRMFEAWRDSGEFSGLVLGDPATAVASSTV